MAIDHVKDKIQGKEGVRRSQVRKRRPRALVLVQKVSRTNPTGRIGSEEWLGGIGCRQERFIGACICLLLRLHLPADATETINKATAKIQDKEGVHQAQTPRAPSERVAVGKGG